MSQDILTLPAPAADERIAYGADPAQFGDLRLPAGPGPHPVVVAVHGGFWRARYDLTHLGHLCAALTARGFATWSLEYRRLGQPGGGWPGTFADVARGLDALAALAASRPLDLGRCVVLGHSAGGQLALWLAARPRIPPDSPLHAPAPLVPRGVIALAAVADLRRGSALRLSSGVVDELLGGPPEAFPERYAAASPLELLPLGVPQVLIHGTDDANVPYELSAGYAARARVLGDAVELVTLGAMAHFEPIDPRSAAWPSVLDAVRALAAVG